MKSLFLLQSTIDVWNKNLSLLANYTLIHCPLTTYPMNNQSISNPHAILNICLSCDCLPLRHLCHIFLYRWKNDCMHTFEFRLNRLIITRAHVYPIVSNKSLSYSSLLYLHFFSHISEGIYIYTSMYIFMCIYIRIHSLVTLSLSCSLSIFLSLSHNNGDDF